VALKKATERQIAISQIIIGAFFFACRSCEYLKVPKQDQQQTKQLNLRNIAFFKDGNIISHSSSKLHLADSVSLTFKSQKNNKKEQNNRAVGHGPKLAVPSETVGCNCEAY